MLKTSYLCLYLKKLEKEELSKIQVSRKKEFLKIKPNLSIILCVLNMCNFYLSKILEYKSMKWKTGNQKTNLV